ncbi:MAG TPA: CoA transferase, partial [Trebonia sp.]|nr:CoA transferase [Trebonia sp.]
GICSGINVIEAGAGSAAASIAGMVLADAGARVLKLEPPEGDRLRDLHPSGFRIWNRGKESCVADLRTEAGQHHFREIARAADVVIMGFAPGRAERWNLGSDELCAANPALVYCDITAFGTDGPLAGIKGYDTLVAAKAGLYARGAFSYREGPIMFPVPWASFGSGLQAAAGILAALVGRETSGRGQRVSATMVAGLEPLDYFMQVVVQLAAKRGDASVPLDPRAVAKANRFGVLVCTRDGRYIQTSAQLPHQARALARVAGIAHHFEGERFSAMPQFASPEDAHDYEELLWTAFRARDLSYWVPRLEAEPNIGWEIAVTSEEGLTHPQIAHNGDVVTVRDPEVGPIRQVGPLAHFQRTPMGPRRPAPRLGENKGPLLPGPRPPGSGDTPRYPLDGVTIVEFGYFYAMPYGAALAAALGARVIKIEGPDGDPHREAWGHDVATAKTVAGKESVSLDLRTPEGLRAARAIIARANVFIDGFRAGASERLGLGYGELSALNPRLVYIHSGGYGSSGPAAGRACYAQTAQTAGGSFGRQVGYWADPARNADLSVLEIEHLILPRLHQVTDGDSNAALTVLTTIALAVFEQRRNGTGQFVSTSMLAGNAWAYADDFCAYAGKPPVPLCDPEYFGVGALNRLYETAAGWICLAVDTAREWEAFARAAGIPHALTDDRFASDQTRRDHDGELTDLLTVTFSTASAKTWEDTLGAAGVGCVVVGETGLGGFIAREPALLAGGVTVAYDHPQFGPLVRLSAPARFSASPPRVEPPSVRGQHNVPVLREAGYDEAGIARLESLGALIPPGR